MPENLSKKATLSSTASNNSEDPAGLTILRTVNSGKPYFFSIWNTLYLPKNLLIECYQIGQISKHKEIDPQQFSG